jgi:hypothetical protein
MTPRQEDIRSPGRDSRLAPYYVVGSYSDRAVGGVEGGVALRQEMLID